MRTKEYVEPTVTWSHAGVIKEYAESLQRMDGIDVDEAYWQAETDVDEEILEREYILMADDVTELLREIETDGFYTIRIEVNGTYKHGFAWNVIQIGTGRALLNRLLLDSSKAFEVHHIGSTLKVKCVSDSGTSLFTIIPE